MADITKKEQDGEHVSSHYLVVEDPEQPSTWHLLMKDATGAVAHHLLGSAWAALHGGYRGARYDGPDKLDAISKLKGLYNTAGIDLPCESAAAATRSASMSEVKDGMVRIAVAYTGKFEKGGIPYEFTLKDLQQIKQKLSERETPIDYEHLSAQTVPPGWSKAAAWFTTKPGEIEEFTEGRKILWAWAELTPAALPMVRDKEYRYFSPEPHWQALDEKGKNIGTRIAAGALTNRPFLKDLPPIEISASDYPQLLESVTMSESKRLLAFEPETTHVPTLSDKEKAMAKAKSVRFKKLVDGDDKGKVGVFADDEMVGMCDSATMKAYMAENRDPSEEAADGESARMTEVARVQAACFSELAAAKPGDVVTLAEKFVDDGRFDTRAFLRAQRIERLIDKHARAGHFKPTQRAAMFSMAIKDYDNAVVYLSEAGPVVDLTNHGIEGTGQENLDNEKLIAAGVQALMTERKIPYSKAYSVFAKENPQLVAGYRAKTTAAK